MKTRILMLFFLAATYARAQQSEFVIHPNGLIYSESTMASLHRIVDSMNLRFKKCEPWKEYRALSQAIGHYVWLDTGAVRTARTDLAQGISLEAFRKKYPHARIQDSLLVTRRIRLPYPDDDDERRKPVAVFESLETQPYVYSEVSHEDTSLAAANLRGRWVVEYTPKSKWSGESVAAFYFPIGFESRALNARATRAVQYADCMIDTASDIFFPGAQRVSRWYNDDELKPRIARDVWKARVAAIGIPPEPKWKDYVKDKNGRSDAYHDAFHAWDSIRLARIGAALSADSSMRNALAAVVAEAKHVGNFDGELDVFAEQHLSPVHALALKRSRYVVGGCSQDHAPRYHALAIARLAAETISWDIFLRAHLDIMNDNFERVSDGSYAWEGRQTYLRELEALDFDVAELMMGTTYRIANPSGSHYLSSIPRTGRALAEYSNPEKLEARMAADIADTTLDDYNRMMVYYLFKSYAYHCGDGERGRKADASFRAAAETLPAYLRRRLHD